MSEEYQTKTTAQPAPIATKKAPEPIPKDPGSSHEKRSAPEVSGAAPASGSPKAWEIDAPPRIEIIGTGTGKLATLNVWIPVRLPPKWGVISTGPRYQALVGGNTAITIHSSPSTLPVIGEPFYLRNPAYAIALDFRPHMAGTFQSTLEIEVLDTPTQRLSIPIIALSDSAQVGVARPTTLPKFSPSERIKLPSQVHLGDTVVGSRNAFTVAAPVIENGHAGTAQFRRAATRQSPKLTQSPAPGKQPTQALPNLTNLRTVKPTTETISPKEKMIYLRGGLEAPIEVTFAPDRPGEFSEALEVGVTWDDHNQETHIIALAALAHGIKDLPWKDRDDGIPFAEIATHNHKLTKDERASEEMVEYNTAATDAAFHADMLADKQGVGVGMVKEEVALFDRKKPAEPWWAELLESALLSGIAGVAAIAARGFARTVQTTISKKMKETIKNVNDTRRVLFTTDMLKDSLKQAGKEAVQNHKTGAKKDERAKDAPETPGQGQLSADSTIDFFAQQELLCIELRATNRAMIEKQKHQLLPMFSANPRAAIQTMNGLKDGFVEAQKAAPETQALATISGWMQGVARATLGTELLPQKQRQHPSLMVTRMDIPKDRFGDSYMVDGLMSLSVSIQTFRNEITGAKVLTANANGVAKSAIDRFKSVPISQLQLPLRVQTMWSGGISTITRDEAGRVRVEGRLPHSSGTYGEIDMLKSAERVMELIGMRSVASSGVTIKTDDAHEKSVEKP